MQMTAPMKKDMSNTIPMELTPSWAISFTYSLKNIRMRSGREKVRPISIRYLPSVFSQRKMSIFYLFFVFLLAKLIKKRKKTTT